MCRRRLISPAHVSRLLLRASPPILLLLAMVQFRVALAVAVGVLDTDTPLPVPHTAACPISDCICCSCRARRVCVPSQAFNTATGALMTTFGSGFGSGPNCMNQPSDVAVSLQGDVYVADSLNHRISVFASDGYFLCELGKGRGTANGCFEGVSGIDVSSDGMVFACDWKNDRIQVRWRLAALIDNVRAGGAECCRCVGMANDPTALLCVAVTVRVAVTVPSRRAGSSRAAVSSRSDPARTRLGCVAVVGCRHHSCGDSYGDSAGGSGGDDVTRSHIPSQLRSVVAASTVARRRHVPQGRWCRRESRELH